MMNAANQPGVTTGPGGTGLWDRIMNGVGDVADVWSKYEQSTWRQEQRHEAQQDETERLQRQIESIRVQTILDDQSKTIAGQSNLINRRNLIIGGIGFVGLVGFGLAVRG